jgi:hypothetical protein
LDRKRFNGVSGIVPIVMSAIAFGLLIVALATGWDKGDPDEGTPAHLFQLLIVAQVPFILAFIATADWSKAGRVARTLALQAAALVLAFAPVAIFRL